jgi:hypothetical protein
MKRWIIVGVATALLGIAHRPAESEPPELAQAGQVGPLMQLKLEKSKQLLEGLALEDFNQVNKSARAIRLLSLEGGWNVLQTEEYASQSRDFRRTAELIADAAQAKDIGRATLGYVAMTVRCVECHTYMRKHRAQLMRY